MLVQITQSIIREFRWPKIPAKQDINNNVVNILDRYEGGAWGKDYFSGLKNIPDEEVLENAYYEYEEERARKTKEEEKEREHKKNEWKFFEGFQKYYADIHKLEEFIEKNSHLLYAIDVKWFHTYLVWLSSVKKFAKKGLPPTRKIGEIFIAELEKRGEYNNVAKQIWSRFIQKNFWGK